MKLVRASLFVLLVTVGCAHGDQRFQPMPDNTALDTHSGKRCNPDPRQDQNTPADRQLPLCSELKD